MDLRFSTAMAHRTQQLGIDSRQSCQCPSIVPIIFSIALGDPLHLLGVRHDHFVSQLGEQPAYPGGMCPCLQCDETSRYLSKGLLHRFRCRWQFLFQNDLACFIQNTVERPAISQIQADRQLLFLENFALRCLHSDSLFHSRSPFVCASSASTIGSVSHPVETGLLIPSEKRDYRNVGNSSKGRRTSELSGTAEGTSVPVR